jgi:hypothetical protein
LGQATSLRRTPPQDDEVVNGTRPATRFPIQGKRLAVVEGLCHASNLLDFDTRPCTFRHVGDSLCDTSGMWEKRSIVSGCFMMARSAWKGVLGRCLGDVGKPQGVVGATAFSSKHGGRLA